MSPDGLVRGGLTPGARGEDSRARLWHYPNSAKCHLRTPSESGLNLEVPAVLIGPQGSDPQCWG